MLPLKKLFFTLFLCIFTIIIFAQNNSTRYYAMDYMKVESSNVKDYLACEKAWKKIHMAKKESGAIEGWGLEQIISPMGSSTEYNFVTRQVFKDRNQLAEYQSKKYFPENWKSLLTAEEIELVNRTGELRTHVKNEVWSSEEREVAADMSDADYAVINYFKMPDNVGRADHLKVEREFWKPFHQHNIKEGKMKGWVLLNRELPMGSDYEYDLVTVDVYKDLHQFWAPFDEANFSRLNNGKSSEEIFEKTRAVGIRRSAEIRKSLDSTFSPNSMTTSKPSMKN